MGFGPLRSHRWTPLSARSATRALAAGAAIAVAVPAVVVPTAEATHAPETSKTEWIADGVAPELSADGRYVAYSSSDDSIVAGDTNGAQDVFVTDRQTRVTERISVATDGTQGNSVSGDDADSLGREVAISDDARFVAFASGASNLVPNDTNNVRDTFVHDRQTRQTELISVALDAQAGDEWSAEMAISGDGRYVAFTSWATNLVPNDTNDTADVFLRDRQSGTTQRVSVATDGTEAEGGPYAQSYNQAVSDDGRFVAFSSAADNLVSGDTKNARDVFVKDRQTGVLELISVWSPAFFGTHLYSISADGRYVSYTRGVRDRVTGDLDTDSLGYLSGDGAFVAASADDATVPGDSNGFSDVFRRNRATGVFDIASVADDGTQANARVNNPAISADGEHVAFDSDANSLDPGRRKGVFVRDVGPTPPLKPAPYDGTVTIRSGGSEYTEQVRGLVDVQPGIFGPSIRIDARWRWSGFVKASVKCFFICTGVLQSDTPSGFTDEANGGIPFGFGSGNDTRGRVNWFKIFLRQFPNLGIAVGQYQLIVQEH